MATEQYYYLDVPQMERAVAQIHHRRAELQIAGAELRGHAHGADWHGHIADRFRSDVEQGMVYLQELDVAYAEVAEMLGQQIEQQVHASGLPAAPMGASR